MYTKHPSGKISEKCVGPIFLLILILNTDFEVTFVVFDEKLINLMGKFQEKFLETKNSLRNVIHERNEVNGPFNLKLKVKEDRINFLDFWPTRQNCNQFVIQCLFKNHTLLFYECKLV